VDFELLADAISNATGIPIVGDKQFKKAKLDMSHYEPFVNTTYREGSKAIFPFSHLKQRFSSLIKVIMKYFIYEGRYSRLYSYHVRLLMHFTRVRMLNFPYYLYRSMDKMSSVVQRSNPSQQM